MGPTGYPGPHTTPHTHTHKKTSRRKWTTHFCTCFSGNLTDIFLSRRKFQELLAWMDGKITLLCSFSWWWYCLRGLMDGRKNRIRREKYRENGRGKPCPNDIMSSCAFSFGWGAFRYIIVLMRCFVASENNDKPKIPKSSISVNVMSRENTRNNLFGCFLPKTW